MLFWITGVNPAGDAGDTSPIFWLGDVNGNIPPILLRTFGYSRPIVVALRSLSLKPVWGGVFPSPYLTPFGGSSPQSWTRVDATEEISIDSSTAVSVKGEQCHVSSRRGRLHTDSSWLAITPFLMSRANLTMCTMSHWLPVVRYVTDTEYRYIATKCNMTHSATRHWKRCERA